ncbi:phenylalanine 4-monooxygenase [Oceanibium sediminis]|uniref:phenylalanine 4-monooxygenase n=1 Tax=Oceanibium sediminis TaxID=2026339 RepID=UPI000DD4CCD7|nr:phenylalanine 4-monooxygenase [Oceanibium sediminis]
MNDLSPERRPVGAVAPDFTVDQNWAAYTPEEHARWDRLVARMRALLPGRACQAYLDALHTTELFQGGIPDMEELSARLQALTGWRVVPVAGLVPDEVFFDHLANRRFPAGAFLRSEAEFDYIEEPDIFHDIFGHVPLLADPTYAAFMEAYGKAGPRAIAANALPALARLYWYTIEFGLIEEAGGLRLFGAGIMSSPTETRFALEDASPNRLGFELERVMHTRYRIDDFQQSYFVIESFETLLEQAERDFGPIYATFAAEKAHAPDVVLAEDRVYHRGTQAYFRRPEG